MSLHNKSTARETLGTNFSVVRAHPLKIDGSFLPETQKFGLHNIGDFLRSHAGLIGTTLPNFLFSGLAALFSDNLKG
jgi:hypothetical protein